MAASPFNRLLGRELRLLAGDWRSRLSAVFIVVLALAGALTVTESFRLEMAEYELALDEYAVETRQASTASLAQTPHPAIKPPWRLAFLVDGGQTQVPNVLLLTLSPWDRWERLDSWHHSDGSRPGAEPLDLAFLLRVVISFAAILLGFDAFSATWQRGRLALVLSLPVLRREILAAKVTALWIAVAAPFAVAVLTSAGVVTLYGRPRLEAGEWMSVALVTALGLWTALIYVLLVVNVSLRSRRASHSLAALALLWTAFVVVIPAAGVLGARLLRPVASESELAQKLEEARRQSEAEHGAPSLRPWAMAQADDFAAERRTASIERARAARQDALWRSHLEAQRAQLRMARNLMMISPTALVQDLAERLTGTGPERDARFIAQARARRRALAHHVESLDRDDPDSPHILFMPGYLSTRPAADGDVPRFVFDEMTLGERARIALGRLGLLLLWSLVLALAAGLGFRRWVP